METSAAPSKKFSIWKILGIILLVLVIGFAFLVFSGTDDYNKEGDAVNAKLTQIISQLKDLRIDEIYKEAHPEFKKVTSEENFANIFNTFPILTTFTTSVTKISHGNGEAKITGDLYDENDKSTPFTLSFKKDGEVWKFYTLDVSEKNIAPIRSDSTDATTGKEDKTAKIQKINVGQTYDKNQIVNNESTIPATAPVILISVTATQSVDKIAANIAFIHTETGDTINQTQLLYKETDGSFLHTVFKFTKPTNGWPKGTIKIIATLANGDTKETSFESK